ncbi:MAG: putative metallopeptidase [Candidatus Micrarchaeota archaeon]|nr:putative metallopeptidase [Candidatus Micrarchaeota archaeon]
MQVRFEKADDVQEIVDDVVETLGEGLEHVNQYRIFCMRSTGSGARAYARIWSLPRIWQQALDINPYYVVEVLSEKYDVLDDEQKTKVIIHELLHIPKTFSGALVPHTCFGKRIDNRRVNEVYAEYLRRKK